MVEPLPNGWGGDSHRQASSWNYIDGRSHQGKVPHDVRKLIFPMIATPWNPWINQGYSQSHQEAHSQKGWAWESSPGHFRAPWRGKILL